MELPAKASVMCTDRRCSALQTRKLYNPKALLATLDDHLLVYEYYIITGSTGKSTCKLSNLQVTLYVIRTACVCTFHDANRSAIRVRAKLLSFPLSTSISRSLSNGKRTCI